jgi:hypothetical protein
MRNSIFLTDNLADLKTSSPKLAHILVGVWIVAHFVAALMFGFLRDAFRIGGALTKLLPLMCLAIELIILLSTSLLL